MAKKRKNPFEDEGFPAIGGSLNVGGAPELPGVDMQGLISLIGGMSDSEGVTLFSMVSHLAETGITPEKYTLVYNAYQKIKPMIEQTMGSYPMRSSRRAVESTRKPTVKDKTILLKIQMKDVSKPPMWREVEVASDMTFLNLHHVIQEVTGLDNYHLWQFNRHAYDESVQIGMPMADDDDFDMGLEYITDDAGDTPVSAYLSEEGDKLEYVYDFGDDWIFTVTVKKVIDRKSEHPVCTAFKSRLNAIEDCGGPWEYMEARKILDGWDKMKKREREAAADARGFDSAEDYREYLEDSLFDMEFVNEGLAEL